MLIENPSLFGLPKYQIMDPVHGGIELFSHERKIIDHPLFLRLRHIKQNDILHYVFPGATHSRFEHCIGTMHVSAKILTNMIRNYMTETNTNNLSREDKESIQYLYGCLRIAALLHDVGHLPFSHQFEESDFGLIILKDKEVLNDLWKDVSDNIIKSFPTQMNHEHLSIRCAIKILEDVKLNDSLPFEASDIIGMMENGDSEPSQKFVQGALNIIKLFVRDHTLLKLFKDSDIAIKTRNLFKDIISSEVDADKMDYLLRDSYFSGCKYGVYNIDHLTQNLCVGFDIGADLNKSWLGIALKMKGLGALEDFVFSRFRMYLQVYNHKTVIGFKWLLNKAISEIMQIEQNVYTVKNCLSNVLSFSQLTDTFFWEAFREEASKNNESACFSLVNRIKLVHIGSIENAADFEKVNMKKELESKTSKDIIFHEAPSKFSKVKPKYDRLRLLVKDKISNRRELKSIPKTSSFFSKFDDIIVTHFFISPNSI